MCIQELIARTLIVDVNWLETKNVAFSFLAAAKNKSLQKRSLYILIV